MMKFFKWILILAGGLILIIVLALLVIPMFVDVQQYKPHIEKRVSEAVGRPFSLGGDLKFSLFPWAGLSFNDLKLGNPSGFEEKDFVSIHSFDVRVKLLPLLSKDIQIKRFVVQGAQVVLEKTRDGRVNWEFKEKTLKELPSETQREIPKTGNSFEGLPLKALSVGEFEVSDGSVLWIDHAKNERKKVSDMRLHLKDISLDQPVHLDFFARVENHPLSLTGHIGPMGKDIGKGTIPLDLSLKAVDHLAMNLKGRIVDPISRLQFDMAVDISPFSPRELADNLGEKFPIVTADPKAFGRIAFRTRLKGDLQQISLLDGMLEIDDSKADFSFDVKDLSKPAVIFDFNLDRIDADRYLPPSSETKPAEKTEKAEPSNSELKKMDYTPLRRIVLDGDVKLGELKIAKARIQGVHLKISGKKGLFDLDPITLNLYQGTLSAKGAFDVRQDDPRSRISLQADGIQARPLLNDVLDKDCLEGNAKAQVELNVTGDEADRIKKSLNGSGNLLFNDGAIKGIDLAGMVRNVKVAFGLAEKGAEEIRTDFSELNFPFTITDGVVNTTNATLMSPLLRVTANGKADLVSEILDLRMEPKFVATLKGQADSMERVGIMVPVQVTGTFSSPTFRPDLKGILKQDIKEVLPELKQQIKEGAIEKEDLKKSMEEKAKQLIRDLPFGR